MIRHNRCEHLSFHTQKNQKSFQKQEDLYSGKESHTDSEGNYIIPQRIVDSIVLRLAEPYVRGEFNTMMLKDVRMLVQIGAEDDEVAHFILEKQSNYSNHRSHRSQSDIMRLSDRWRSRMEYDDAYMHYRQQSEVSLDLYQRVMNKMESTYDLYRRFTEQHRDHGGPVDGGYRVPTDRFYSM